MKFPNGQVAVHNITDTISTSSNQALKQDFHIKFIGHCLLFS